MSVLTRTNLSKRVVNKKIHISYTAVFLLIFWLNPSQIILPIQKYESPTKRKSLTNM